MSATALVIAHPTAAAPQVRLPQVYEAARQALAVCESMDECKDWSDRAAALASYAKQGRDDELMKRAIRIRDRATRRCGELLQQYDDRGRPAKISTATDTNLSQRAAAEQAGLSKRQQVTAVRVANVPADQFEELVESDKPPTVTALANIGKSAKPTQQPEESIMECAETMEDANSPTKRYGAKTFVPDGQDLVELCKRGLALEKGGQTIESVAAELGIAINAYRVSRQIVFLADRSELSIADKATVTRAVDTLKTTHQYTKAWEAAEPVAQRMWGTPQRGDRLLSLAGRRMERFETTFMLVMQSCLTTNEVQLPYLSSQQSEQCVKELRRAKKALTAFSASIQEIHR